MEKESPISALPKSVLVKVFHFLDSFKSFSSLSLTCKQFQRVTQDASYWHNFKLGALHQLRPGEQTTKLLQKATMVENINIRFQQSESGKYIEFLETVCSKPQVKDLKFNELKLSDEFAHRMARWIQDHRNLRVLHLEETVISEQSFSILAQALAKNESLKRLAFKDISGAPGNLSALGSVFASPEPQITELFLTGTFVSQEVIGNLGQALEKNTTLKTLSLRACYLNHNHINLLCPGIIKNATLERLDLYANSLNGNAADSLSRVIAENSSLRYFSIYGNAMNDEGASKLFRALGVNSILEHFNIYNNKLSDRSGEALLEGIQNNTSLRILQIGGHPWTDKVAGPLYEIIKSSQNSIERLEMANSEIGPQLKAQFMELGMRSFIP